MPAKRVTMRSVSPQVISVSRRTDVPAFFTPWWRRRIDAGHVLVRNPRNPKHIIKVSLCPNDVLAIVYWSRDYSKLLPHLPELDARGYRSCFHLTLTDYGPPLERNGPQTAFVLKQFESLAHRYGPNRITWRYDPIIMGSRHDVTFHENNFRRLADILAPLVRQCVISFFDPYPAARRELAQIEKTGAERFDVPDWSTRRALTRSIVQISKQCHLPVRACCEENISDLVPPARCIDVGWIQEFAPAPAAFFRSAPTRKGCGCTFARDIGAYHTCGHSCVYCYANESPQVARQNADAVETHANHLGKGTLAPCAPKKKKPIDSGQLTLANVASVKA